MPESGGAVPGSSDGAVPGSEGALPEEKAPEEKALSDSGGTVPKGDGPALPGASTGLDPPERAELERLRAEVTQMHDKTKARRRRIGWRAPVATLLIIIGCVLAPVSVLGVWASNQVTNTNRYVANIEPLIHDPSIQNALTDKITIQITKHLNVTGYANQAASALTSRGLTRVGALLRTFAPSLASAIAGFIHTQVHKIITSPQIANIWLQVNRTAHAQLVKVLSGQGNSAISTSNGQVILDLGPFINIIKQDLVKRGFTIINSLPPIHPTIALFSSKSLVQAQTLYRLINALKWVLPFLSLVLIALGVYIARSHRRALVGAGLGFAASMVLLGALLAIFRGAYINSVPNSLVPSDAAAAAFDIMVRYIKEGLRVLLVIGLVVAAAAFFTGPSITAVRTRGAFVSGLGWLRETGEHAGLRTGPVGRWTYAHRMGLRIGATALMALILVFSGQPTGLTVLWLAIVLLILLGLIELIGRRPAEARDGGQRWRRLRPAAGPRDRPGGRARAAGRAVADRFADRRRLPRLGPAPAHRTVLPGRGPHHDDHHGHRRTAGAALGGPEPATRARAALRAAPWPWHHRVRRRGRGGGPQAQAAGSRQARAGHHVEVGGQPRSVQRFSGRGPGVHARGDLHRRDAGDRHGTSQH